MAKAGSYTPERQYFCRYFRLLVETGPKPLRKLLTHEASASNQSIQQFVSACQHQIHILKKCRFLGVKQYDLIFPHYPKQVDLEEWDLSLLVLIIRNCCNLKKLNPALDTIRTERNYLCHHSSPCIDENDFISRWNRVKSAIQKILTCCSDKVFEKTILNEIDQLREDSIDIGRTCDLFCEYIKRYGDQEEVIEELETVQSQMEDIQRSQRIQHSEWKVVKGKTESLACKIDNIENLFERRSRKEIYLGQDRSEMLKPNINVLYRQTEAVLGKHEFFVKTKEFHAARKLLEDTGCVVICGAPGEGKTSLAYQLMREYRRMCSNKCVEIFSPSDVCEIEPGTFSVILIDQIFGYLNMDEQKYHSWLPVLERMHNLVQAYAFKLIIVTDTLVFNECHRSLTKYSLFKNSVSLGSRNLDTMEKKNILLSSLRKANKTAFLLESDVQECVQSYDSDTSFPLLCDMFVSRDIFLGQKETFFRRKMLSRCNILDQLNKEKKETLFDLWTLGGNCTLESLAQKRSSKYDDERLTDNLKQNVDILQNIFLRRDHDRYVFVSKCMYESIGLYFAEKEYYKEIIEEGSFDFFMEYIRIKDNEETDAIVVPRHKQNLVVKRVIKEVIENKNIIEIIQHPCLTIDIMDMIFNELKHNRTLKSFLMAEQRADGTGGQFLQHALEQSLPSANSYLEKVVEHVGCKNHKIKLRECKLFKMFQNAFLGAIRGKNPIAVMSLGFVKFSGKDVLNEAVRVRNVAVYQVVSNLVQKSSKIFLEYQYSALLISIDTCCAPIFTFILNQGVLPGADCLLLASQKKATYFMLKQMLKILTQNNTQPISISVSMWKILKNLDGFDKEDLLETFSVLSRGQSYLKYRDMHCQGCSQNCLKYLK